jgi:ABC-type multidrug transport system permease subunit
VQQVAYVNPFTYIAIAYQKLIIVGFDWTAIWQCLAAIFIIGAISLTASVLVFRRKIS